MEVQRFKLNACLSCLTGFCETVVGLVCHYNSSSAFLIEVADSPLWERLRRFSGKRLLYKTSKRHVCIDAPLYLYIIVNKDQPLMAATPGSSFPSMASNIAPPPVDT